MKSVAKTVSVVLAVVVFLILFSSLLVALLFDPNQYRAEICRLVQEKTGRNLKINGAIEFNVFPWLGLKANNVEMAGSDKTSDQPLITIDRIKLRVHFLSLIRKQLEIGKISLSGVNLHLLLKEREQHWRDLIPTPIDHGSLLPTGLSDPQATQIMALTIGGVNLKRSSIVWTEPTTGKRLIIRNLNLQSGPIALQKEFQVKSSFDFVDENAGSKGHVQLSCSVAVNLDHGRLDLNQLRVRMKLEQPSRFSEPVDFVAEARWLGYSDKGRLDWQGLHIMQGKTGLQSDGALTFKDSDYRLSGRASFDSPDFHRFLEQLGFTEAFDHKNDGFKTVRLECGLNGDKSTLRLSDCEGELDQSSFTGWLTLNDKAPHNLSFHMAMDRLDLNRYLKKGSGQSDKPRKQQESGKGEKDERTAKETQQSFLRTPCRMSNHTLSLSFVRRLGTALSSEIISCALAEAAVNPQKPASSSPNGDLAVHGDIDIDHLTWGRLNFTRVSLKVSSLDQHINLMPVRAQLYDGKLDATVRIDRHRTKIVTGLSASEVHLDKMMQDLKGETRTSGRLQLQAHLVTSGDRRIEHLRNLSGELKVKVSDFHGAGFDIRQAIINATPALKGKLPLGPARKPGARLDLLRATLTFKDGKMHLKSLDGRSKHVHLSGSGAADLVRGTLDFVITAVMSEEQGSKEQHSYAFLNGVPIPFRIKGTFSRPVVSLDLREVLRNAISTHLEQRRRLRPGLKRRLELRRRRLNVQ